MNSSIDDVTITYPVERSLVQRAVELLSRQRQMTSRFQRFLRWPAIVFVATLLVMIVTAAFYFASDTTSLKWFSAPLFGLLFLAGFVLAVAFLAALPQMAFQWSFFRRLRKMGLGEAALLQNVSWRRRLRQVLGAIFAVLGVGFLWLAGMSFHVSLISSDVEGRDLFGLVGSVVLLVLGLLLTVPHFISRRRQSLDLIERIDELSRQLSEALSQTRPGETVAVRAQDLNMMARMERAHIEAERQEAVARARREERPDDLVLLNTRDAVDEIRALEPETRIQVQEQAAELTHAVVSPGAEWDEESGLWRLVVPDTRVQLQYAIDTEKHQVRLVSVVNLEEGRQATDSGDTVRR